MTIEIRELLIRSIVEHDEASAASGTEAAGAGLPQDADQVRLELQAECQAWLAEKLQNQRER